MGDAIFAQREICRHIRDRNGHYLFTVKGNQPELERGLPRPSATGPPSDGTPPDLRRAETTDKRHGRIEVRKITVSSEAVPHLDGPGLAQIARIERHRHIEGCDSIEVADVITSLPAHEASPKRLLELNRAHWAIENRLHCTKLKELGLQLIVLEATGGFETVVTAALASAKLPVVVVNPAQVRSFAKALGQRAKTDRIDGEVIARFAEATKPELRALPDEQTQLLADLVGAPQTDHRELGAERQREKRATQRPKEHRAAAEGA